ncbi:hypothetical protein F4W70_21815 [Pseudomonas cannabina]|nr:hypothetical protein F4W70_21815 [Pseudomonas cannabina]
MAGSRKNYPQTLSNLHDNPVTRRIGGMQELQEVTTAAMGCEAALKQDTSVLPDTPRRLVLLPVPGSSRTSEASPGLLLALRAEACFPSSSRLVHHAGRGASAQESGRNRTTQPSPKLHSRDTPPP